LDIKDVQARYKFVAAPYPQSIEEMCLERATLYIQYEMEASFEGFPMVRVPVRRKWWQFRKPRFRWEYSPSFEEWLERKKKGPTT